MAWWQRKPYTQPVEAPEEKKMVDLSQMAWSIVLGEGAQAKSGASVTTKTALSTTAFWRGVNVIADGIAQLPVTVYQRTPDGRGATPATDHPLYELFAYAPNGYQDPVSYFSTAIMHAVSTGNHVSMVNRVGGRIRELIPLDPSKVLFEVRPDGDLIYYVTTEYGRAFTLTSRDVFHLKGPSWDGYKGVDPVFVGREALGLAQATEETHARFHAQGARPSGVLATDNLLNQAQIDEIRTAWQQVMSGASNSGKTAVLGAGLKWQQVQMKGVDAEHLDTRKHQIEEIARLLGVFPIMLGHSGDQSPTFASAAAFMEAHVRSTLQPWIKRIIAAVHKQLMTAEDRASGIHLKIDTTEILRGSPEQRAKMYKDALGTNSSPGWLSVNEVREDDGWDAVEGDKFDKPLTPADYAVLTGKESTDEQASDATQEPAQ